MYLQLPLKLSIFTIKERTLSEGHMKDKYLPSEIFNVKNYEIVFNETEVKRALELLRLL